MKLSIDEKMVNTIVEATIAGLSMTEVVPVPVGASRISTARHELSVIVGLVGRNSGNMTLNLSKTAMLFLAGRLMEQPQSEVSEENIDAVMELGNMLAGCVKEQLLGSEYGIEKISLPSLIAGQRYNVMYARGILTVSVEFEITEMPVTTFSDRYFSATVSLLRGSGVSSLTPSASAA
jgi:CheY-specific phosphatase CheX